VARLRVRLAALAVLVALPIVVLVAANGIACLPLLYPRLLSHAKGIVVNAYRSYYINFDRDDIQYNPACARYDPDLFYTLKPGSCTFANREFSVEYRINSLGVRDDEESLRAPEVVVLGDSGAMGWAVAQDETFSAIIGRKTHLRVLNTAVSSYGTARELLMLNKVDRSKLRYVILQYCNNDFEENVAFLDQGYVLPIHDRKAYEDAAARLANRQKPWLLAWLLSDIWTTWRARGTSPPPDVTRDEVSALVQTLEHGTTWGDVKLIVLEVSGDARNNPRFAAELRRQIADPALPAAIREATVLDSARLLTVDDYYLLDDHLNRRGHHTIAAAIVPLLH
jgi:hypothetical protein